MILRSRLEASRRFRDALAMPVAMRSRCARFTMLPRNLRQVAGPSGTHWKDEDRSSVSTEGADAGSFVIRWDNSGRTSPESAMLGTGASGTCGDETGDASHAFDYMDGADTRIDDLKEEVHLSLCSYCCSPRLRTIFAGGEDQH